MSKATTTHKVVKAGCKTIPIEDADRRSIPPAGPELLALGKNYQQRGMLPKVYAPSVLRLVDGVWYAPQMCNR